MPRYFFHAEVGATTMRDPEGEVLPDADAARRAAHAIVRQLLDAGRRDMLTASLNVVDGTGDQILRIPFAVERNLDER